MKSLEDDGIYPVIRQAFKEMIEVDGLNKIFKRLRRFIV
jgi:hypothetical protein